MRLLFLFLIGVTFGSVPARAQFNNPGLTSDAVLAIMPQPSDVIPPADTVTGAIGIDVSRYQLADAARPRLSRAKLISLDGTGAGTFDYSSLPMPANSTAMVAPVYSGSGIPKCWTVGAASTTSVSIKCVVENATTLLNLSIITAGLNLNINTGSLSGLQANVVVLPPSP